MRASTAARRYARALFGIAREDGTVTEVGRELGTLRTLIDEDLELHEALMTPLRPAAQRKGVLRALTERLGLSPAVRQFVLYLIDQRRLVAFHAIHDEYERLAAEASGVLTAKVVAASALDERKQDRLRRALSDRTGRAVKLDITVDRSLIGGAIATVGDLVFDGSLRTQLGRLRANLEKGS